MVDWLNYMSNLEVTSLTGWMEKIRQLITPFNTIIFDHIYREENVEEDIISKKSLQVPKGRIHYKK
jgi:hypothetical protein